MTPRRLLPFSLLAAGLVGCVGGLDDNRTPTGSSTVAASADYAVIYSVDSDAGAILSMELDAGAIDRVEVGGEPTRIVRIGDRLIASLRTERALVVLRDGPNGLEEIQRVETGAEPLGLVASEDGSRLYVVSSLSGRVDELDGDSLETLRSWTVDGEPRWLALHPSNKALYVGSAFGGRVSWIDLDDDNGVARIDLPPISSIHLEDFSEIVLTPRVTGDPAVSPDGDTLAVPMLYVDNTSPVAAPQLDGDDSFDEFGEFGGGGGYDGGAAARFNPGVTLVTLLDDGSPKVDDIVTVGLVGVDSDFGTVRGYPASVTFSPGGDDVLATIEGSGAVVSVPMNGSTTASAGGAPGRSVEPMMAGDSVFFMGGPALELRPVTTWTGDAGPRGVAFVSNKELVVHSFLDRSLAQLELTSTGPSPITSRRGEVQGGELAEAAVLSESVLPPEVELGRRLFYASNNPDVASVGSGVACAVCHFDGRNDGLTWQLRHEAFDPFDPPANPETPAARQTPSLAGVVSMTEPVTWTEGVSVTDEVHITSSGRMGGDGLRDSQIEAVAAYIDWSREADVPQAESDSDAVVRGRALFQRKDVGCITCHSGAALTDNEAYDMFGLDGVVTRSLVGIAASAPYLHDGSSPTLRALLERVRDGSMGDTSNLSDDEMDDLEVYLLTL